MLELLTSLDLDLLLNLFMLAYKRFRIEFAIIIAILFYILFKIAQNMLNKESSQ